MARIEFSRQHASDLLRSCKRLELARGRTVIGDHLLGERLDLRRLRLFESQFA
jgi:hypothetical protein